MRLIRADHERRLQLEGVPRPVRRPVDIDQAQTGFASLRSLRIYCFDAGSVIDGHAEDDEVLIVVLTGSITLTLSSGEVEEASRHFTLAAVDSPEGTPCMAYLPPGGAYRLNAQTDAEVAYARASSAEGSAPAVFCASPRRNESGATLLLEERSYPRRLRMRAFQMQAGTRGVDRTPVADLDAGTEALLHLRSTSPSGGVTALLEPETGTAQPESLQLESWDTAVVVADERLSLRLTPESTVLLLVVFASA